MLKPTSNRSLVSEDERVRYVDGTTCLTFWYDQEKQIIAFEVIFGLAVDEWAFLYHRKGNTRYCRVDDGENRFGRPQKQAMQGITFALYQSMQSVCLHPNRKSHPCSSARHPVRTYPGL